MADKLPFEIPEAFRDLTERNVEQARATFSQFLAMARQTQEMFTRASPLMNDSAREVHDRAFQIAQANLDASFAYALDLTRARDMNEYVQIHTKFTQNQMKSLADQAQELGKLVTEAAQKAQKR